jgi:hypothetical protein
MALGFLILMQVVVNKVFTITSGWFDAVKRLRTDQTVLELEAAGIEPASPRCDRGVLPLYYAPAPPMDAELAFSL